MSNETGCFVAVVGPSGAGKDTLIAYARERLERQGHDIHLARRVVTRIADPGAEDHDSMSESQFARAQKSGAFALSWRAHGLSYGIPAAVLLPLARGRLVVANLSRASLGEMRRIFPRSAVVEVTASPEVLSRRLASRGREAGADIARRVGRVAAIGVAVDLKIVNDGSVEQGGDRLADFLRSLADAPPTPAG